MVDTKALLKTFGTGADVIGQIATDKAVNARRQKQRSYSLVDITNGQLINQAVVSADRTVLHQLQRIPNGAIVVASNQHPVTPLEFTNTTIALGVAYDPNNPPVVSLWVF